MAGSQRTEDAVDGLAAALLGWTSDIELALATLAETIAEHLGQSLRGRGYQLIDSAFVEDRDLTRLVRLVRAMCSASPELMVPATLGQVFEQLMGADDRRKGGAHFTPAAVAAGLVTAATKDWAVPEPCRILDPSSGGGAFLLAAARWLASTASLNRHEAATLVAGRDLDPTAVAVSELTMALWCLELGEEPPPAGRCVIADGLLDPMPEVDLIVGNPPFLSQMAASTVRSKSVRKSVTDRFGPIAGPYADTAAFFIPAALDALRPGGRMVLIQPQSILASRDVEKIRTLATADHRLHGIWYCAEPVFAASVRVCAPIIERSSPTTSDEILRWSGAEVTPTAAVSAAPDSGLASWGPLVSDLVGIPPVALIRSDSDATVGSLASATAGFRDEFYGFAPHTCELADVAAIEAPNQSWPAAITVGMVDALRLRWGTGEFKYAGNRWVRPVVDASAVVDDDEAPHRWMLDRLRPKLVMATQTKAIEVVVDEAGSLLPITPVIAIEPHAGEPHGTDRDTDANSEVLWRLAAALSAPPLSALVLAERLGSALSVHALKLAAVDVMALPLPTDLAAWDAGAHLARVAQRAESAETWSEAMTELGETMCAAYRVDARGLTDWWFERLPGYR